MLMSIDCSAVTSVKVCLTFDDNTVKERVIGTGDYVCIDFNKNGARKRIEGKVLKVYAEGEDTRLWYLIVDGSAYYDSGVERFSVLSILDCEIIKKADASRIVETPNDITAISSIRLYNGNVQYSVDGGFTWTNVVPTDTITNEGSNTTISSSSDDNNNDTTEVTG